MLEIPQHLHETLAGKYVLKREIGRGGAATVYLAHDARHERLVAVKLLHPELSTALGAQRFLREIRLTAGLQHPHILSIHDSGEVNGQLFYVMPFVEGDSLRQRLSADNRLSIEEAVRIGREVAGALAYAHEHGIVHRDIKPENILFSGGHAVLADFGIARAINRAHETITQQGTITGTPAYMSPEQARDRAFDGRSDVYSLACVLYEAMAGVPPFLGDTPQILLSQRVTKTAPKLREYRHDVPAPIEAVIAKALAMSPDDRFDDARAFSAALSTAVGNSGELRTGQEQRRPLSQNPWMWAAAVAVVTTVTAVATPGGRDKLDLITGRIDTAQYAVVPFQYVNAKTPPGDEEPVAQGLYAAMREWNGLHLATDLSVSDAIRSFGDSSLQDSRSAARRVRAGKLVWGRVFVTKDSLRIRGGGYDAIDGTSLKEQGLVGPRTLLSSQPGAIRALAADLLRLPNTPADARSGDVGTRSLEAWHAYQEGQRELAAWRLEGAMAAFERATMADADYAYPRVWLSQLQVWRREPVTRWAPHLSVALRNRASLGVREASLTDALQQIQANHFDNACRAYDALRMRDSLDAVAWIGLTYCRAFDRIVVRNVHSRSGWTFRGSMAGAQRAYTQALRIAPGAFATLPFSSLEWLFTLETNRLRNGVGADSAAYRGYPDLVEDTIAYAAFPGATILAGAPSSVVSPFLDRAIRRNRDVFLATLVALTQRLPENAEVFESLARVLEARDEITGTPNGGYSALSALERAIVLSKDSTQRARLGASDVRLHLKLGDFARSFALGDSILNIGGQPTGQIALSRAGIAALLGREHLAVRSLRASGMTVSLTGAPTMPLLDDVSAALFVRASLGVCDDSLRALRARVDVLLDSYVNPAQRAKASESILARPLSLGVQCFGPPATLALHDFAAPLGPVLQWLGRGDTARARVQLDSNQTARALYRPGEISLDLTVTEAWVRAALHDTTAAMHQLDLTLTALPTLSSFVVYEPGMAAAVGRAMVLRAELASRRGDAATAALWAGRVLTLWAKSDPSLAPTLARMRRLATRPS